ncbi:isopropylmalate isomerase [Ruegeria marisrubri]|uniref:Isopropylmalate isomerase n=1 Tax=Ruegeria marisrubri TaxID=1685379 RepID=A0A0X3U502_9RHOB|nr:GNAT family N-acetyltransferase [Ruegeria marisrubri]KUJ83183.1 isopropylmalate isomerase [Ruegeria marisrubri]
MTADISPYFGDAKVQALQKARDQQVSELTDVPGAVVHARIFSSDDPKTLGWDRLRKVMSEEGMITLRGVDEAALDVAKRELGSFRPNLHFWDLFMAEANTIREVCGKIVETGFPYGLIPVPEAELTPQKVRDVQSFLADQGVSPFSRDALLGRLFPARLNVLQHKDGRIAAAGFSAMTHNHYSPFTETAWVGLIAVDPELRGLGLGRLTDALCNLSAIDELGAKATMEFVGRDNAPSRAMLESCGLKQVQGKSVVMFSTSTDRMTR